MGPTSLSTSNKAKIAAQVVLEIRALNPPGRFLELNKNSGLWNDIGDVRARKKATQSLREDAKAFCKALEPAKISNDSQPQKVTRGSDESHGKGNNANLDIAGGCSNVFVSEHNNQQVVMPDLNQSDEVITLITAIQSEIEELRKGNI